MDHYIINPSDRTFHVGWAAAAICNTGGIHRSRIALSERRCPTHLASAMVQLSKVRTNASHFDRSKRNDLKGESKSWLTIYKASSSVQLHKYQPASEDARLPVYNGWHNGLKFAIFVVLSVLVL